MNKIIYLEILDIYINVQFKNTTTIKSRFGEILKTLIINNPIYFKTKNQHQIKKAIISIFPIYKNKRKHNKRFKLTLNQAKKFINENNINLRMK